MEIKSTSKGYIQITMNPYEALERLLPNVHGENVEIILTGGMDPLVFYVEGIAAQDLLRLQKESQYRNGPLWDRLLTGEDLTTRTRSVLECADIDTFGKLVSVNRIKLLKYRNVGKKTLCEIEDLLHKHGLEFIG